ncbi:MAG TPA: hypothetical protein VJ843_01655 [Candidatus Saccharimonadales bacterium]|nr:hypothetical protein [Candidatus Saccharimonadales bacterium]
MQKNMTLLSLFSVTLLANCTFYFWYVVQHTKYVGANTPTAIIVLGVVSLLLSLLSLFLSGYFLGKTKSKISIFGLLVGGIGAAPFLVAAMAILIRAIPFII